MSRGSWYAEVPIARTLRAIGREDVPAHQVEAWMLLERGTLDGLLAQGSGPGLSWAQEVEIAVACVDASTPARNEALAESYGLAAASA